MSFIFIALWIFITYKISSALFKKLDKSIERATNSVVSSIWGVVNWGFSMTSSLVRNIIRKPINAIWKKWLRKIIWKEWLELWNSLIEWIRNNTERKIKNFYNPNIKPIIGDIKLAMKKVWDSEVWNSDSINETKEIVSNTLDTATSKTTISWLEWLGKILENNQKVQLDFLFEKDKTDKEIEFTKNENNIKILESLLGGKLDELISITKWKFVEIDINGRIKKFDKDKMKSLDNEELNKIVSFINSVIKEKQNDSKLKKQEFTEKDIKITTELNKTKLQEEMKSTTVNITNNNDTINKIENTQKIDSINKIEVAQNIDNNTEITQDIDNNMDRNITIENQNKLEQMINTGANIDIKNETKVKKWTIPKIQDAKIVEKVVQVETLKKDNIIKEKDNTAKKEFKKLEDNIYQRISSWVDNIKLSFELDKKEVINKVKTSTERNTSQVDYLVKKIKSIPLTDIKSDLLNLNTLLLQKLEDSNKFSKIDNKILLDDKTLSILTQSFKAIKWQTSDVNSNSRIMSELMLQKIDIIWTLLKQSSQQVSLEKNQLLNFLSISNEKLINMLSDITKETNINTTSTINITN